LITGFYDAANGAYITASVFFPAPVDELLVVSFLVDTGATSTCIGITDLLRLSQNSQNRLPMTPVPHGMRGIGGSITPCVTPAAIGFVHDDGQTSLFDLSLNMMIGQEAVGIPALLGRDILYRGDLQFHPKAGLVLLDLPVGTATIG
jgi:hypothetical protein